MSVIGPNLTALYCNGCRSSVVEAYTQTFDKKMK